jgi:hypothetical protein
MPGLRSATGVKAPPTGRLPVGETITANVDLRHLDFRLKGSWRSALGALEQAAVTMDAWDQNPPEEYRELFAETDRAAAACSASIEQGL